MGGPSESDLLLEVTAESGESWIGRFRAGYYDPNAITAVCALPDPTKLCVVCAGQAYIVPVSDPGEWEDGAVFPVMDVRAAPERDMVLLADFIRIAAYTREGLAWRSARLSFDGLRITDITDAEVRGCGWSAPEGKEVEFRVDLATGAHQGGASPEQDLVPAPTEDSREALYALADRVCLAALALLRSVPPERLAKTDWEGADEDDVRDLLEMPAAYARWQLTGQDRFIYLARGLQPDLALADEAARAVEAALREWDSVVGGETLAPQLRAAAAVALQDYRAARESLEAG